MVNKNATFAPLSTEDRKEKIGVVGFSGADRDEVVRYVTHYPKDHFICPWCGTTAINQKAMTKHWERCKPHEEECPKLEQCTISQRVVQPLESAPLMLESREKKTADDSSAVAFSHDNLDSTADQDKRPVQNEESLEKHSESKAALVKQPAKKRRSEKDRKANAPSTNDENPDAKLVEKKADGSLRETRESARASAREKTKPINVSGKIIQK